MSGLRRIRPNRSSRCASIRPERRSPPEGVREISPVVWNRFTQRTALAMLTLNARPPDCGTTRPRPPPQPRAREDRRKEPSPPPPSRGVNEEAEINRFGNPPTDSVRSDTALNYHIRQYMESLRSLLGQKEKLHQLLIPITPLQRRPIAAAGFLKRRFSTRTRSYFLRPTASSRQGH